MKFFLLKNWNGNVVTVEKIDFFFVQRNPISLRRFIIKMFVLHQNTFTVRFFAMETNNGNEINIYDAKKF